MKVKEAKYFYEVNPCKREGCPNFARREYCSATCRKAAWLGRHILRCPRCYEPLEGLLLGNQAAALGPRANIVLNAGS